MEDKSNLTLNIEILKKEILANDKLKDYEFKSFFGVGDLSTILQATKSDNNIINNVTKIDGVEVNEHSDLLDAYECMIVIFTKIANELNIPDQLLIDFEEIKSIFSTLEYVQTTPEIGFDGTNYFIVMRYNIFKD